jgi:hypothetical protein
LRANIEHTGERALALDMDLGHSGLPAAVGDDILPPWAERARAVLERTRRHEEIMQRTAGQAQRVIPVQAQKIAEKVEGVKIGL